VQQKTKDAYLKLALNFRMKHLNGAKPTPKRVIAALKKCAGEYRPAYWRRLRNALAYAQEDAGFKENAVKINATTNPITAEDSQVKPKPKVKRAKKVTEADHQKLMSVLKKYNDKPAQAAIYLCKNLGCRPAELPNIVVQGSVIYVESAKKNDGMKRGLDRMINVDPEIAKAIGKAAKIIRTEIKEKRKVKQIQDRLYKYAKEAFPRRQARISLYSYRHQMGSNLKSDKSLSSKQVAYIMGHQATSSIEQYGHVKSGTGSAGIEPTISKEDINKLVRDTVKPMNEAAMRPIKDSNAEYSPNIPSMKM
jgi:integrase